MTKSSRVRQPNTILRKAREAVKRSHYWLNHRKHPTSTVGDTWLETNQSILRALSLLSELRRSLKPRTRRGEVARITRGGREP